MMQPINVAVAPQTTNRESSFDNSLSLYVYYATRARINMAVSSERANALTVAQQLIHRQSRFSSKKPRGPTRGYHYSCDSYCERSDRRFYGHMALSFVQQPNKKDESLRKLSVRLRYFSQLRGTFGRRKFFYNYQHFPQCCIRDEGTIDRYTI